MWQKTYDGALRIMLPDTFGTTQFLEGAPDWAADWTGQRIDSKDPYIAGDEYIAWLKARGRDPHTKLIIASDALDVDEADDAGDEPVGFGSDDEIRLAHRSEGFGTLGAMARPALDEDGFHDRRGGQGL